MKKMLTKQNLIFGLTLFLTSCLFYSKQITDILANPDAVWNGLLYKSDWRWETSLNRFVIKWLQDIRCHVINTSISSIICLLLLSIGAIFITEIFHISSLAYQLVIGLLILLSVNTGCLLTYYYCSDMYALSFLCIVGATYFTLEKNSIGTEIASIVLIVIGLGIYQAYIVSLITLLLLHLFQDIFCLDWQDIWKKAVRGTRIVVLGLLGYVIASKLALMIYEVTAESSRGFSSMGNLEIKCTIRKIIESYYYFFQYYLGTAMINNKTGWRREIHAIYFILLFILLLMCLGRVREGWRRALIVAVIAFLPISVMCIHILAPEVSILSSTGPLMLPAMSYAYILGVLTINCLEREYLKFALIAAEGLVLYVGMSLNLVGQAYLEYSTMKAKNVAREMASAIEETVDNSEDYKLCIVGTMEGGNYEDELAELKENLQWTTFSYGAVWSDYNGAQGCWIELLKRTSGRVYHSCSNDEFTALKTNGTLENMAVFPDEGSVYATENNLIVVKLGTNIQ